VFNLQIKSPVSLNGTFLGNFADVIKFSAEKVPFY